MSRWFRFYDDTLNDPKTLKLSDKTFRIWVGILCAASKNEGKIPLFDDLVILLRISASKLQPEIEKLIAAELIDHDDDGMKPHNWDRRQYKSDVSTERVKRFRNAERNVSETPPETEADTENRIEKKDSRAVAPATRPNRSEVFEEFWRAYPKRQGANPRKPALQVFEAAVKQGADPAAIINGAKRCAIADRDKIGTPYIPQAVKWLRDRRWEDYQPPQTAGPVSTAPVGAPTDEELRKRYGHPAIPAKAETSCENGVRADHADELPRARDEIRPGLRPM